MIWKHGTPEEWHDIRTAVEDAISNCYQAIFDLITESIENQMKGDLELNDDDQSSLNDAIEYMLEIDSRQLFEELKRTLTRKKSYTYQWSDEHGAYTLFTDEDGTQWVVIKDSSFAAYVNDVSISAPWTEMGRSGRHFDGLCYGSTFDFMVPEDGGILALSVPKNWVPQSDYAKWHDSVCYISDYGNTQKMARGGSDASEDQGNDDATDQEAPPVQDGSDAEG
jgi:hypothetical protein